MSCEDFSDRAAVIPKWPNLYGRGKAVPKELLGATIVAIGTMEFSSEKDQPEGGGLVIDYTPKGTLDVRRITLAFTDIGMWRHPIPSPDED
jgi:hypothetical protein